MSFLKDLLIAVHVPVKILGSLTWADNANINKRKYNADIELLQKAVAEWEERLTDVLENRSERNRWINHFMQFSTMEEIRTPCS